MADERPNFLDEQRAPDDVAASIDRLHDLRLAADFVGALALCDEAIRQQPDQPHGYQRRGGTLRQMGRLNEALAGFNKLVELVPDREYAYYGRGTVLFELGRYAEAVADYSRSAELDHDQFFGAVNYLYRAECYFRLGDYEAALADCARVPDDFDFPGFRNRPNGSKQLIIDDIERIRGKSTAAR
ncbi:MAG TPA: tetratricopeptide repeat protein [Candidatus Sulfotelmatobacter sp.]|nr:tetratricopeptide repeat protein [Candidatus Sulfotelmatobacter sp.]